ncbi:hypothetical protein OO006_10250 [Prosthecochloris sp. SCSIO W1101]|uniref:hypothetical protein n=1 Tax=Prosthecochloris sp. SCSIO W1101 TaxID=2992242 RepID=UPI00223D7028|nr:hypothetical protein [Prosthecochloris sp. SCSIO W1101]UZJ40730.1 hypothetical protein OO006_10250 [Prosthecochloris sp. SCSIO W1101]
MNEDDMLMCEALPISVTALEWRRLCRSVFVTSMAITAIESEDFRVVSASGILGRIHDEVCFLLQ